MAHLLQGLEPEMAKPSMPSPLVVVVAGCQAHGPRRLEREDVEAVRRALYLGEQLLAATIPHPENAVVDVDLAAILIELTDA